MRAFVFLAALGEPLPSDGRDWNFGMPAGWSACLHAPEPTKPGSRRDRLRCAAAVVTLPAFAALARQVAAPWPAAATGAPASGAAATAAAAAASSAAVAPPLPPPPQSPAGLLPTGVVLVGPPPAATA